MLAPVSQQSQFFGRLNAVNLHDLIDRVQVTVYLTPF